ncbi:MAG: hypothetical protein J5801_05455 [Bacteroidales bacterium]|nr:hypothetical protein [Bacteroidales bacterium]
MRSTGTIISGLAVSLALVAFCSPGCSNEDKLKASQLEEELAALQEKQVPGVHDAQDVIQYSDEPFSFEFGAVRYGVDAGGSVAVGYTLAADATVEVIYDGGWSTTVNTTDGRTGSIVVTCPDPAFPADILVKATAADGRSTVATLPLLVRDPYTDATRTDIPALAYFCFDRSLATDYHFKMMADAGFNMLTIESVDNWQEQLDLAYKYGMKGILFINGPAGSYYYSGGTDTQLAEVVNEAKNYPALYGYQIVDEPIVDDIEQYVYERDAVHALDPEHPIYINMYPGSPSQRSPTVESYIEYVETYTTRCQLSFITFDQYPVWVTGVEPSWYTSLNVIRNISREHGIPFWAFTLCCREWYREDPTLGNIRLQCNTNLAYGAQVNQYFVYRSTSGTDFAPLQTWEYDANGDKVEAVKYTAAYDYCKAYNAEMHNRGYVFAGSDVKVIRKSQVLDAWSGSLSLNDLPPQIASLYTSREAVVSFVENNGNEYLVVVNSMWNWTQQVAIDLTDVVYLIDHDGNFKELQPGISRFDLEGGDMLVFKYR